MLIDIFRQNEEGMEVEGARKTECFLRFQLHAAKEVKVLVNKLLIPCFME